MDLETRIREKPHITKEDVKAGLCELGLREGDLVAVHSSLSAFGYVEGGADTVIDGLIETLGESGTLVMPSFTSLKPYNNAGYNPETTPAGTGIITDTFWRRPDVIRGSHPPRKPWAAQGPLGQVLIALSERRGHDGQHYLAILNAIADLDGYILLLGCLNSSSTSIHTAQVAAFNEVEGATKRMAEFLRCGVAAYNMPGKGCDSFNQLDVPLLRAGVMRKGKIGDAEIRLMRSRGLFDVVKNIYQTKYRAMDLPVFPDYVPEPNVSIETEYKDVIAELKTLKLDSRVGPLE